MSCDMGTVIHLRRRLPAVSSGRPGSRATPLASNFRPTAPLFGLAPGRACPFHPTHHCWLSARLCGAGPRLSANGSYPLPCVVELGLSSCQLRLAPTGHATIRPSRWHLNLTAGVFTGGYSPMVRWLAVLLTIATAAACSSMPSSPSESPGQETPGHSATPSPSATSAPTAGLHS